MKIFAISNQKGGVGKTTSTINISAGLVEKGFNVLAIDLDPQGNLSSGLGIKNPQFTIHGTLLGEYPLKPFKIRENFYVVACNNAFSSFEKLKGDDLEKEFLLAECLKSVSTLFDFVLLDCPPSLGLITINAFVASQSIYVPLEAQLYSTEGLLKVIEMEAKIKKRLNPKLALKGLFFTRFDKRKILKRETLESIKSDFSSLFLNSTIRETIGLGEAPHMAKDIFDYAPESAGASDYAQLVDEILKIEEVIPITQVT